MKKKAYYIYSLKKLWEIFPVAVFCLLFYPALLYPQQPTDSLALKLKNLSNVEKVNLLNQFADATNRESILQPNSYAEQALQIAKEINYRYGEAIARRNLGFNHYRKNELGKAEPQFKKALEIFLQLKDSFQLCDTYNQIGLLYWKKDQFIPAYQYFRISLKISTAKNLKREEAQALNYIGLIYWKWSEYPSALDYFAQALTIKEKLKDTFEIGVTLNNIANIYNELNRPDEAIIYASRCLISSQNLKNKYVFGRALNNLGVSYFKKNDFARSINYQNKSLEIKVEGVDLVGEAYSLSDLGEVYFAKKDFAKALAYFQKALSIWDTLHDSFGISKTTLNLGKVYAAQKLWAEAEAAFSKSLLEAKNNQNKKNIAQAYLALSSLYEAKQEYQKALETHKLYSLVSDSLLNTATSDKVAELRVISEMDEKEKEVELLTKEKKIQSLEIDKQLTTNKIFLIVVLASFAILLLLVFRFVKIRRLQILLEEKNKAISQKSKELEDANAAKDKFFSIIAHDLKSPFTGLLGYSQILSEEFDSMEHDEKIKTIGYLKTLIERVYTLIENLLDWSRIQTSRIELIPVTINLAVGIPEILTLLKANSEKKNITIINKILNPIFVFVDNYSFRSIIQNLVANAVKFTNPEGSIIISAEEKSGFVEICIVDNGIGIEADLLKKIFKIETRHSTTGTANESGTGLGLLLCKELAEKNGGNISIESTVGVGTTIYLSLPKGKEAL